MSFDSAQDERGLKHDMITRIYKREHGAPSSL